MKYIFPIKKIICRDNLYICLKYIIFKVNIGLLMDTMGDNLETKIREFRQIKGLTQQELADSVGVTRQTINALENARYNPSLLLAYRITKILDQESIEDVFIIDGGNEE